MTHRMLQLFVVVLGVHRLSHGVYLPFRDDSLLLIDLHAHLDPHLSQRFVRLDLLDGTELAMLIANAHRLERLDLGVLVCDG